MPPRGQASAYAYANDDELEAYMSESDEESPVQLSDSANEPKLADEMKKAIVIENLPVVTEDKLAKLKDRVNEMLRKIDAVGEITLFMPLVDSAEGGKSTQGFAIAAFSSHARDHESVQDKAKRAIESIHGFKFGKNELAVFSYADLDKFNKLSSAFVPPKPAEYSPGVDLSWLEDGRDQFVMRHGAETVVMWVSSVSRQAKMQVAYDGAREKVGGKQWCKKFVQWSPLGTYLTTFHDPGFILWGGETFTTSPRCRFAHQGVSHAVFSPCERYVITWDGQDANADDSLIAWNVPANEKLCTFRVPAGAEWPHAKWSFDGSFFGRMGLNGILLYKSPTMERVERGIPAKGIVAFEFSPADNLVAYWAPEEDNAPARVVIVDLLTRKEVRSANLFQVTTVKLIWQNGGDFLCAQVLRHTKTKKSTFTNLEIFRIRDEGIPNETLSTLHNVECVAFEPTPGVRFGLVTSNEGKFDVAFHSMGAAKGGGKLVPVVAMENKQCSQLYWSPSGGICVLAGLEASMNGTLDFYDVDLKQSLNTVEHYMVNDVKWDPSGRIVASIVAQRMFGQVSVRESLENGFKLWSSQGHALQTRAQNDFYQFLWRPRPKSLLSDAALEDVRKRLAHFARQYDREDEMVLRREMAAENAERLSQLEEFRAMMRSLHAIYVEQQRRRRELGLYRDADVNDVTEIQETTEVELQVATEEA